jgi:glucokinase
VGVVDSSGNLIDSSRCSTPTEGGKELISSVINLIKEFNKKYEIKGIGISIAALISSDYGTIVGAPNIANLSKLNFVNEIKEEFELPIIIENDANAAMWAEFKFGNAKGLNPVMFFIIGTGVGGGLVIDGKLFKGANGIGAEFGHMCVVPNGLLCGCGSKGCIEQYASGGALIRYANEALLANPDKSEEVLSFGEGKLSGTALTKAAKAGNELALAAFSKQADWLGLACASYSLIIDPQAIIIGGGVVDAGELFLAPVRAAMRKYMPFAESHVPPKIIAAKFGNDAGLIGAADLVRV